MATPSLGMCIPSRIQLGVFIYCPVDWIHRFFVVFFFFLLLWSKNIGSNSVSGFQLTGGADCAEFHFNAHELYLDVDGEEMDRYQVRGELTEDGTDITFEASKEFKVEYIKLTLTPINNDNRYFKPGLPFVDQVCET